MKNFYLLFLLINLLFSCSAIKTSPDKLASLEGNWELNYITGLKIAFVGLYPNKKPTIAFNLKENRVSGNNSCNSYSGKLDVLENKINFSGPMAVTKMMCIEAQGEQVYMESLRKIDSYSISGDGKILSFIMNDIVIMRFEKK